MKKLLIALASTGLLSFGAAAQAAGDASAGASAYGTCIGCHGSAGEGGVAKLAGQTPAKIVELLHKYKAGEQVGPMTPMMAPMAAGLSDADIENIAAYAATL